MSSNATDTGSPPARLDGTKVLVVDDDADQVTLLHDVLTRAGAVVVSVTSVGEALTRFSEIRPDVIVSDLTMPGTDGYQFIRMVRARRPADGGSTPAIALTGSVGDGPHSRALLFGFQSYLPKPVGPETLVRAVHDLTAKGA